MQNPLNTDVNFSKKNLIKNWL